MRISTNLQYQQLAAHMSKASSDLAQMQGKVASGLKFNTPSQAPEMVGRSVALQSRIAGFKADVATLGQVRLGIDSQATALEAAQPLLTRLKELSLQGASQQFTQTERDAMAADPAWGDYLKASAELGAILSQENRILKPAAFSPLK